MDTEDKADSALLMAKEALVKIEGHEKICGTRWKETRDELRSNRRLLQSLLISLLLVFVAALARELS